MTRYVAGFYRHNDDVLLIRKNKPEWQKGKLNGVGGKIEDGETPEDAMRREFLEETGRDVEGWEFRVKLVIPGQAEVHFFAVDGKAFSPRPCNEGTFEWSEMAEIPYLKTIPNLRWLIPLCFDGNIAPLTITEVEATPAERGRDVVVSAES